MNRASAHFLSKISHVWTSMSPNPAEDMKRKQTQTARAYHWIWMRNSLMKNCSLLATILIYEFNVSSNLLSSLYFILYYETNSLFVLSLKFTVYQQPDFTPSLLRLSQMYYNLCAKVYFIIIHINIEMSQNLNPQPKQNPFTL